MMRKGRRSWLPVSTGPCPPKEGPFLSTMQQQAHARMHECMNACMHACMALAALGPGRERGVSNPLGFVSSHVEHQLRYDNAMRMGVVPVPAYSSLTPGTTASRLLQLPPATAAWAW